MFGVKTSLVSRMALVAAAMALGTAQLEAADLGGNCCADLEERVAELEATTARKGNRKVSLQVYGQVSEAILWWNDGSESNVYVAENHETKNRLGFQGSAKINSDWSAGYKIEVQVRAYRSSALSQRSLGASNNVQISTYNTQSIALREANWFIRSNTYGTLAVGRQGEASASVDLINLGNPDGFATHGYAAGRSHQGFFMRRSGRTGNAGTSGLDWNRAFHRNNSNTADYGYSTDFAGVKYTSPFFLGQSKTTGFNLQASFGMDDAYSVALRYVETFGSIRVAAGIGYSMWSNSDMLQCANLSGPANTSLDSAVDCSSFSGSASIMHVPSGVYLSGGYGQLEDKNRKTLASTLSAGLSARVKETDSSWWVQAGWVAKLNALGSTTFWANYASYESHGNIRNQAFEGIGANDVLNSFAGVATINVLKAESNTWSVGVTQDISAASMKIYAGYLSSSADLTLINRATSETRKSNPIDDFGVFFTGATIRF
jgi:hypothetical protein